MRRLKYALAFFLLVFLAVGAPARAQSVTALQYGPWSQWQIQPIEEKAGLEVEGQMQTQKSQETQWKYTRYVYFNTLKEGWYAAAREITADYCQEGSGRWEEQVCSQPLNVQGKDGEDVIYQGSWFNQEEVISTSSQQQMMYRSRQVERITCEVTSQQMLMLPSEVRQLTVNFFDGGSLTFLSDSPQIAAVDQQGNIYAHQEGIAHVTVNSSRGRQVTVDVLVCKKQAQIEDGVYTLRLAGGSRALDVGKRLGKNSNNIAVREYTGETSQRFVVKGTGESSFTLHPLEKKKWNVGAARKKNKLAAGNNIFVGKEKDKSAQTWQAIGVPDGSYIIYPRVKPQLVMGADPQDVGANVGLEALGAMDEADRWILIRADAAKAPAVSFAKPVNRDGSAYVARDFSPEHPGLEIQANGKRAVVLSAARGTVIEVGDACDHDYAKDLGTGEAFPDPCGEENRGLGRYVIVDHGGGITCLYAHLSSLSVAKGDSLRQGSIIGRMGATGSADQAGLYFEMAKDSQPMDPRTYIELPLTGSPIT